MNAVTATTTTTTESSENPIGLAAAFADRDPLAFGRFPDAGKLPHSFATPFNEHCVFKTAVNGVIGGGMGIAWGLFTSSMSANTMPMTAPPPLPTAPGTISSTTTAAANPLRTSAGDFVNTDISTKEAFRRTGRDMYRASKTSAKTFAVLGALYTANECTLEKIRGCHDSTNAVIAGCSTGAMIGMRGGPQAAAISCAGFAAFGMVMERFMGNL